MSRFKSRVSPYTRKVVIAHAKKYLPSYIKVYSEFNRIKFLGCRPTLTEFKKFKKALANEQFPEVITSIDTYTSESLSRICTVYVRFDV